MARTLRQPHAALADLCDGFFDEVEFVYDCPRLTAEQIPPPLDRLLVHREHMTARLEAYYGQPVDLHVLAEQREDDRYARKIALTLRGLPTVVEFGIASIRLHYLPEAARAAVLQRREPLGDILIRHNVLRRISPRWYFRFPPDTPIATALLGEAAEHGGDRPVIGRVGTIYCDEEPAIELLEVVVEARGVTGGK